MKASSKFLLLFIPLFFLFFSCKKNPFKTIERGTWIVNKFVNAEKDETSLYSGFKFQFWDDGTLMVAQSDGSAYQGSWGYDYDTNNYWFIFSDKAESLKNLSDQWHVVSIKGKLIELSDGNPDKTESMELERVD